MPNPTLDEVRQNPLIQNFEELGNLIKPDFSGPNDGLNGLMKLMEILAIASPGAKAGLKGLRGLGQVGGLKQEVDALRKFQARQASGNMFGDRRGVSKRILKNDRIKEELEESSLKERIFNLFNQGK
jgi:hypothetical protein